MRQYLFEQLEKWFITWFVTLFITDREYFFLKLVDIKFVYANELEKEIGQ